MILPTPPPPPTSPMPEPGTEAWARWNISNSFQPDDAAIVEYLCTWKHRWQRISEYAIACHERRWSGWQATLAWSVIEALTEPLATDDDIPF